MNPWPTRELDSFTVSLWPDGGRRTEIRLDGRLPGDWAARVSAGLALAGVSIEAATARRLGPQAASAWTARLWCVAGRARLDAPMVRHLVTTPSLAAPARWPLLAGFTLDAPGAGPSRLHVVAADSVGFLGELLRALALHGVFATALDVTTRDGRADDTLLLASVGQGALSATAWATLDRSLRAAVAS
jgi:hypothetical protein